MKKRYKCINGVVQTGATIEEASAFENSSEVQLEDTFDAAQGDLNDSRRRKRSHTVPGSRHPWARHRRRVDEHRSR